jgi:IS5 family transposase
LRNKINNQSEFNFQVSNLTITNNYFAKYEAISKILDKNPKILDLIHRDLQPTMKKMAGAARKRGAKFEYTSDTILRMSLCQIIEGCSLREIVVRVDDSNYLRIFVRIFNGPMIDYTTFNRLKNKILPQTWKKINTMLAETAVEEEQITGEQLRLDTTAVETNIHWPTDSSLLWDTYRTLARLIEQIREVFPSAVGDKRLLIKKAKRLQQKIARQASNKGPSAKAVKPLYIKLIGLVERVCQWSDTILTALELQAAKKRSSPLERATLQYLHEQMRHYRRLGERVIDQARRRVIDGEQIPNKEKIFSIVEPHTELLKRGKAGKPIEFGHMIQIQQVESKFITDYDIFEIKPVEHELVEPALESHEKLFGCYPGQLATDKGYFEDMARIEQLEQEIEVVSIAKKGKRTEEQTQREHDPLFRHAQRFRAGVEGTISFLKRVLGLARCYSKGWQHYAATIGATIVAHNLLILARC